MTRESMLLTMPDAAERLGFARSQMYRLVLRGEILSLKIGRSRRIAVQDLESFVQRLRREQGLISSGK